MNSHIWSLAKIPTCRVLDPSNPPEVTLHLHVLHDEAVDGHAHSVGVHLARRVLMVLGLHFVCESCKSVMTCGFLSICEVSLDL